MTVEENLRLAERPGSELRYDLIYELFPELRQRGALGEKFANLRRGAVQHRQSFINRVSAASGIPVIVNGYTHLLIRAKRFALKAQIADARASHGGPARRWMPTLAAGLSLGEYARSLVRRLAALTAVLVVAIWAINGQGYFWPAWVWLGLIVPEGSRK